MCLYPDPKYHDVKNPKPLITKEDINVFKVLHEFFMRSPHQKQHYELNVLYTAQLGIRESLAFIADNCKFSEVNDGLHAWRDLESAKADSGALNTIERYRENSPRYKIFNAVIPKGSEIYIGDNGDIVSNALKVTEKI